jgi:hypothetical protein
VTELDEQPVFAVQLTVPLRTDDFTLPLRVLRPFISPLSLLIVAVNVTDDP